MRYVLIVIASVSILIAACGNQDQNSASTTGAVDGKDLYNKKCGICHGRDGKLMASGAPDLTVSKMEKQGIVQIITMGKGNMPPHKETLTTTEIAAIADHVITLRSPQ